LRVGHHGCELDIGVAKAAAARTNHDDRRNAETANSFDDRAVRRREPAEEKTRAKLDAVRAASFGFKGIVDRTAADLEDHGARILDSGVAVSQPDQPSDGGGSELAVEATLGKGDFYDISSIVSDEITTTNMYYRLLNSDAGHRRMRQFPDSYGCAQTRAGVRRAQRQAVHAGFVFNIRFESKHCDSAVLL
jgi:hypothetical protein